MNLQMADQFLTKIIQVSCNLEHAITSVLLVVIK